MSGPPDRGDETARGVRIRAAAWAVIACSFATQIALTLADSDPIWRSRVSAAFMPFYTLAAFGAAAWAMSRAKGKPFRMYRLLTIAMGAFFAGMTYRSVVVFKTAAFPPAVSFEDAAFVLGYLVLVPVVLLLTEPFEVVRPRKLRNALDLASILTMVASVTVLYVLEPAESLSSSASAAWNAVVIIYSIVGWGFVLYLLAFKRTRWRSADVLMLSALAAGALGGTLGISRIGDYIPGSDLAVTTNLILAAAFALFALGSVHGAVQKVYASITATPEMDLPHWPGIVSLVLGLVGIPTLMLTAVRIDEAYTRVLLSSSATLLVLIVLARSVIVTFENRRLAEQSIWDPLTGIFNHRYFRKRVAEEAAEALRTGGNLSVCMFDVDHFDSFNSTYGYRHGDKRLRAIAKFTQESASGEALAFRIGGDEFALVLPGYSLVEAQAVCAEVADRARRLTANSLPPATLSVGVASLPQHTTDRDELIRFTMGACYWASSGGGDRIVPFDPREVGALDSRQHVVNLEAQSHLRLVQALAAAVDARDHYTRYHSSNVARLAGSFTERLGLSKERRELIHAAALLHDVGKIGIPDAILTKPDRLEPEEYELIKEHPILGVRILEATGRPEMLPWVESHHEFWDGSGYPRGLSGDGIPLEARILAICDAYDAMTSDRPYRSALPVSDAIDELRACAGTQFDPGLVEGFIESLIDSWPETRIEQSPARPS